MIRLVLIGLLLSLCVGLTAQHAGSAVAKRKHESGGGEIPAGPCDPMAATRGGTGTNTDSVTFRAGPSTRYGSSPWRSPDKDGENGHVSNSSFILFVPSAVFDDLGDAIIYHAGNTWGLFFGVESGDVVVEQGGDDSNYPTERRLRIADPLDTYVVAGQEVEVVLSVNNGSNNSSNSGARLWINKYLVGQVTGVQFYAAGNTLWGGFTSGYYLGANAAGVYPNASGIRNSLTANSLTFGPAQIWYDQYIDEDGCP